MAVEIATAFVSIVPTARGIGGKLAKEIGGPLEAVGKEAGEKASKGYFDSFSGKAKAGAAAAGVAIGAVLAKGLSDAIGQEALNDKLSAQLGLSEQQSAVFGKVAGKLYGQAFGDSFGQVNDAIAAVTRNIGGLSGRALEEVSGKVLNLATTFDQDLGATTAAVGQMIRTGLAKDATEALDIITRGLQIGADKSGDLLDSFNEYGTQFRKLGLDGSSALGIISQGLKAGARDSDIVSDALKEFAIRAVDGSKLTEAGFAAVGLSAADMAAQIAAGGPAAAAGLDVTLDRLRAIEDPVARSGAAVALFGTQAEDLGDALFALDPSEAVKGLGDVAGAADKLGKTLSGNASAKLEAFKRQALQKLAEFAVQFVIPTIEALGRAAASVFGFFAEHERLTLSLAIGIGAVGIAIAASLVPAFIAWAGAALAAAATTLLAMAPLVLLGAAAAALAYLIISNWDTIKAAVAAAASWIGERVAEIGRFFGRVGEMAVSVKDGIVGAFNSVVTFVGELPGRIASVASGMWDGIKNAFKSAINWIIRGWNRLEFKIPGFDPPGPGPTFGGFTLGLPNISELALGGIVTKPTFAMIGEAGPEAVIPLSHSRALSGVGAAEPGLTVHVHGFVGSPEQLAREIGKLAKNGLTADNRRGGALPFRARS